MTIHVTLAELKARLDELVDRARDGEQVVVREDGEDRFALAPMPNAPEMASPEAREALRAKRKAAFGMWRDRLPDPDFEIGPSMSDAELAERDRRKFGPPA